jgi:hypothetical protein
MTRQTLLIIQRRGGAWTMQQDERPKPKESGCKLVASQLKLSDWHMMRAGLLLVPGPTKCSLSLIPFLWVLEDKSGFVSPAPTYQL